MATGTTIDELVILIRADTKQLQGQLDQIEGKLKVTSARSAAAFGAAGGGMAAGMKVATKAGLGLIAVAAGTVMAIGKIAEVGSELEDLKKSLNQVFGGMAQGDAAMQKIFTFAQTTPFQIEDVTKAFIQLKAAGIEPSMNMLQTFADTASTSIDQLGAFEALIRTVQRSASGGFGLEQINQLDDRGIPATAILTTSLGKTRDELTEFGKTAEGAAIMLDILIKGLEKDFGGAMAAKMESLSTKTSNMGIAFKQLAGAIFESGLGDRLKDIADFMARIAGSTATIIRGAMGTQSLSEMAGKDAEVDKKTPKEQLEIAKTLIRETQALATEAQTELDVLYATFDRPMLSASSLFMDATTRAEKAKLKLENLGNEYDRIVTQMETDALPGEANLSTLTVDDTNFMAEFKKLAKDSIDPLIAINEQLDSVALMAGKLDKSGNLIATPEEIARITAFLNDMKDDLSDVTTFSDEMQATIISASEAFTRDFVNSLMEGENALDSFKNFAKDIVSQIITIFLQMGVVNEILNSVFGLTGTKSELPTLPKKAGGGTVQAGQAVTVGERGAEIFVPNTGGTIMNNMNSKNAMGGGGTVINQSINFAVGVVPTVRAEVMKMMPQIADVTKGAVADAAMRGGNFRRALQGG
mgnify:CR=1 FL=1